MGCLITRGREQEAISDIFDEKQVKCILIVVQADLYGISAMEGRIA